MSDRLPAKIEPTPVDAGPAAQNSPPPAGGQTSPIHIFAETARHILSVLRRRWLPFLAVLLFVVFVAGLITVRQTPVYSASSSLVVNSRVLNVAQKNDEVVRAPADNETAVPTEMEIMRSDVVANNTAAVLAGRNLAGFALSVKGRSPAKAVDAIASNIDHNLAVTRNGTSNVVSITFNSSDPVTAKVVADEVAQQYLKTKFATRRSATTLADTGIERELQEQRVKVEAAEAEVARYKQANNLLSTQGVTLTEQQIALYKQQDADARGKLAEEQARLNTARAQLARGSAGDDVGEALNSSVINGLRGQRAQASAKLADLKTRYKDDYPDVVQAQSQLNDIDREIRTEINRVISNLQARVQVAAERAGSASGITSGAVGELQRNNAASVRLNELERQADALRGNYAALLERQNTIATQALITDEDARIFSAAELPTSPSHPNRPLNMIVGFMIGLLMASIVVSLLQIFDRGIVSSVEVERRLGLPHLGNIPSVASVARRGERDLTPEEFVLQRPMSLLAEALRGLRLHVIGHGKSVVGITSARPDEGKSSLAAALARISAIGGTRTLLIDGDVRKPSIAALMGVKPTIGLLDVLQGRVSFEQALISDARSGVAILPTLRGVDTPDTLLNGDEMRDLLDRARDHFDLIIIDTAPALATIDARILLQQVDYVVMAVKWGSTLIPLVQAALKKMRANRIEPEGVVLTQVNMKALARFGYGDIDYNHSAYAKYYQS